jgi:hypothetical protein
VSVCLSPTELTLRDRFQFAVLLDTKICAVHMIVYVSIYEH